MYIYMVYIYIYIWVDYMGKMLAYIYIYIPYMDPTGYGIIDLGRFDHDLTSFSVTGLMVIIGVRTSLTIP